MKADLTQNDVSLQKKIEENKAESNLENKQAEKEINQLKARDDNLTREIDQLKADQDSLRSSEQRSCSLLASQEWTNGRSGWTSQNNKSRHTAIHNR